VAAAMTVTATMMVSVVSGGRDRGRATEDPSHCQGQDRPESSHWFPPRRLSDVVAFTTCSNRNA
jgi:hypothetical protein